MFHNRRIATAISECELASFKERHAASAAGTRTIVPSSTPSTTLIPRADAITDTEIRSPSSSMTAVRPSAPVTRAADGTTSPVTVGAVIIRDASSCCPTTATSEQLSPQMTAPSSPASSTTTVPDCASDLCSPAKPTQSPPVGDEISTRVPAGIMEAWLSVTGTSKLGVSGKPCKTASPPESVAPRTSRSWSSATRIGRLGTNMTSPTSITPVASTPTVRCQALIDATVRVPAFPSAEPLNRPRAASIACTCATSGPSTSGPIARKAGTSPCATTTGRRSTVYSAEPSDTSSPVATPMEVTTPTALFAPTGVGVHDATVLSEMLDPTSPSATRT